MPALSLSLSLSLISPEQDVTLGQGTRQTGLPTTLTTPSPALGPPPHVNQGLRDPHNSQSPRL